MPGREARLTDYSLVACICSHKIMKRPRLRRNNPKAGRVREPPSGIDLAQVAESCRSVGSPYHQDSPSFAGMPRGRRPDASICAGIWRIVGTLSRAGFAKPCGTVKSVHGRADIRATCGFARAAPSTKPARVLPARVGITNILLKLGKRCED